MKKGRAAFSHFVVTRGGRPCVLLVSPAHAPDGVLMPCESEAPTKFLSEPPYATIYARRRVMRAINRTQSLIDRVSGTLAEECPFLKRLTAASGHWKVVPCQPPKQP